MSILLSNEIINSIIEELKYAEKSVQILTAYCKKNTFINLDSVINDTVERKRLLVRFRLDDIINGSTDFDILEYGISKGWEMYIRFDLHAKTYIVDNKRGLVGSANATSSGLNIGKVGNMEIATLVEIESEDLYKINGLFDGAIKIDNELLNKMKNQYNSIDFNNKKKVGYSWDKEITDLFKPSIKALFSYELPDDYLLEKNQYFSFLDYTFYGDLDECKEVFRWSNAYLWLLEQLNMNNGELYFGQLTERLHDTLVTDPKPFRKDVKQMLSNLLKLITELEMDEVVIDRPNHSQRIRLKR